MSVGGKAVPAILLGNDQREKSLRLEKLPDLRRQIAELPIDLPIVQHVAELLDRAINEGLLFVRKHRRRKFQKLLPIGVAAEQLCVPPDIAGFDGFPFRGRHARQHALRPVENRCSDPLASEGGKIHYLSSSET